MYRGLVFFTGHSIVVNQCIFVHVGSKVRKRKFISHSVTCHSTQVNMICQNPSQAS